MGARAWWWGEGGTAVGALAFRYQAGDSLANLRATFTRASTATYIDANGVLQTAASGVARDGHYISGVRTLLLEGQRTNSFLNSGTPATHTSPSLATGTYTLWLVGTDTIAVAAGTATITGAGTATAAAPVTFTVTVAGTVTFTVTGTPTRAQCENGAFPTSYIATAGSAVTRSADRLSFPWLNLPQPTTCYVKGVNGGTAQAPGSARVFQLGSPSFSAGMFNVRSTGIGFVAELNNGGFVASAVTAAVALNDTVEERATLSAAGLWALAQTLNGGAEAAPVSVAYGALPGAFASPLLWLNSDGSASDGFFAFQFVKFALGSLDLATMRGL